MKAGLDIVQESPFSGRNKNLSFLSIPALSSFLVLLISPPLFPFFPLSSGLLSPSPPECWYYWHVPSCPGAEQRFLNARQALSS